jgi:hypothetical protein
MIGHLSFFFKSATPPFFAAAASFLRSANACRCLSRLKIASWSSLTSKADDSYLIGCYDAAVFAPPTG